MTSPTQSRRAIAAYMLVRAVIFTVLGLLLLLRPGETVRALAQLVGLVLLTLGSIDLVVSARSAAAPVVRRLILLRGVTTAGVGAVLVALTDASLTVVAILAGMQLVIGGGVSSLLGSWSRHEVRAWKGVVARGALTVVAGALVIGWPQKSIEIIAVILGIDWLLSGAVSTVVAVAAVSKR